MARGASFFNQLVGSIAERGRGLVDQGLWPTSATPPERAADLCRELVSQRGEAVGAALAVEALAACRQLDESDRLHFFELLVERFSPDAEGIVAAAAAYGEDQDLDHRLALGRAIEAPRVEIFRRLNMAPGGTAGLVELRATLLPHLPGRPEFRAIDSDLAQLFASWFNRGFLVLEEINWRTPAVILEKLIDYEAVHAISGWDDLRRRLDADRRCFAFFHPSLPDEPLIFVEVALVKGMADQVAPLLDITQAPGDPRQADHAIFYSINNCQAGLKGISFGNFLIKQVAAELSAEFSGLRTFATLSPVPGFRRWLDGLGKSDDVVPGDGLDLDAVREDLAANDWPSADDRTERLEKLLPRLCAWYLINAKRDGRPVDAVARFHLGNGASLERINWLADPSAKGLGQAAGLMVNYVYRLDQVEKNHELYVNDGAVVCARAVKAQARAAPLERPEDMS